MFAFKLRKHETTKKTSVFRRCLEISSDGADTTDDGKFKYYMAENIISP